jgi:hypothetical protein
MREIRIILQWTDSQTFIQARQIHVNQLSIRRACSGPDSLRSAHHRFHGIVANRTRAARTNETKGSVCEIPNPLALAFLAQRAQQRTFRYAYDRIALTIAPFSMQWQPALNWPELD